MRVGDNCRVFHVFGCGDWGLLTGVLNVKRKERCACCLYHVASKENT
uniref:Uncharacterized protein n=1 Tax=Myripristis murdjan TaxID=586833 RepID=A0A668AUR2_9TELE